MVVEKPPVNLSVVFDTEYNLNKSVTEEVHYPVEGIDDFIVPKMGQKVTIAISCLKPMCKDIPEALGNEDMLQHVVNRLTGLLQVLRMPGSIKDFTAVMEGFVSILDLFYDMLTRCDLGRELSSTSAVASFCSARAAAQNVAIFHQEIDRLLTVTQLRDTSHATLSDIRDSSSDSIDTTLATEDIHNWQVKWNKMRREELRAFHAWLKNTEGLKQQLSDPKIRLEAQMLLQFELHKRRSSYPNSVLEAITKAIKVLEALTPDAGSFPPYEVVLGKYIAQGSFGDVYHGKWFDTEVVVKILKPQSSATATKGISPPTSTSASSAENAMELFRREADHWFMLNHQNVVHLYGACHVGTLSFVCEPTKSISLNAHVKSLAFVKPGYNYDEKGGDPSDIMRCLLMAGIGLKYLHKHDIVLAT
ncbi:TKL protein kinase [Phytophthora megakarya]|uniref:TKL protein kinase n=1 Tax=Phytophthora megakarya TaxID=4795 RepID=A0A225V793_9STRA|nr:TKL protein kinase [Phytophthora megakarya]